MKKALVGLAMVGLLSGCGHNLSVMGVGTGFRVGNGEYGITYAEGLFGTFVTRDGVKFKAELDSENGFAFDPTTNTYKGIRGMEYSLPPQVTGYAVKFAKENPDVAKAYYEMLEQYYKEQK